MKHILVGILVGFMLAFTNVALAADYVIGPNLVVNGDFESGTTGWGPTPYSTWPIDVINIGAPNGNVLYNHVGPYLKPNRFGGQLVTGLTVGAKYQVQFDRSAINLYAGNVVAGIQVYGANLVSASPDADLLSDGSLAWYDNVPTPAVTGEVVPFGAWVQQTIILEATDSSIALAMGPIAGSATLIDNVSLRAMASVDDELIALIQGLIDASITADNVSDDAATDNAIAADNLEDDASYAPINHSHPLQNHVHDKGSGGRTTGEPILVP